VRYAGTLAPLVGTIPDWEIVLYFYRANKQYHVSVPIRELGRAGDPARHLLRAVSGSLRQPLPAQDALLS
jgi:hypothetical protein